MLCEANARCVRECPELFEVEDGLTLVIKEDPVPQQLQEKVRSAVDACPRQALSLEVE
jgi:ferredoxin